MGKKILVITIGIILALAIGFGVGMVIQNGGISGLFSGDSESEDFTGKVVTTGENTANVYEEADENSEVLYSMSPGETATCVEYSEEWIKLDISGVCGYAHTGLFSLASDEEIAAAEDSDAMKNAEGYVTPTVNILDIHQEMSETSAVVVSVNNGEILELQQKNSEWAKVATLDGQAGYVLLTEITETEYDPNAQLIRVTNTYVNLRSEPTSESENLGQLEYGDTATYLGEEEGFYHIKTADGVECYVSMDYAEVINASDAVTTDAQ